MNTHVDCIACVVNKANKLADKYIKDKRQKHSFMKKVLQAIIDTDYERTAPLLDAKVMRVAKEELGIEDIYKAEKDFFNEKMLQLEPQIAEMLNNSEDKVFDALKIASSGNIIDFSALSSLNFEFVREIIEKTFNNYFNADLYCRLRKELEHCKNLVYLGDNTGEIVLDKLFIKEIKREYPDIEVLFVTRGKPIFNDITETDAYDVEMDKFAKIMNNGTDLPGTDLLEIPLEFREILQKADIIISKGQGNFESLSGSGLNIYYLFLCKCDMIMNKLSSGRFANMFIGER